MGCIESRNKKTFERALLEIDSKLLLNTLSLESIKTVKSLENLLKKHEKKSFFSIKNKKITYEEMVFCLKRANLQYSLRKERDFLRDLLNCFKISSELEIVSFYDFSQVLLLMILYSRNKFVEKYELIFDLFDEDKNELLDTHQIKDLYLNILHIVLHFSIEMLIVSNYLERGSQNYEILVKSTEETVFYSFFLMKFIDFFGV